jgi:hypothetical protein
VAAGDEQELQRIEKEGSIPRDMLLESCPWVLFQDTSADGNGGNCSQKSLLHGRRLGTLLGVMGGFSSFIRVSLTTWQRARSVSKLGKHV